jgi:apolipoprotein N-acyltransferase
LAALWVVGEWVRGWIFGGLPWLPVAASQWQRPMVLQVAAYAGAWSVSFLIVFLNLGVAAFLHRLMFEPGASKRSPEFMAALMVLVLTSFPFISEMLGQQRDKLARVALVQPYIPQGEKWDPARAKEVLGIIEDVTLGAAVADNPDVIVWPEAVVPWALHRDPSVRFWLESLSRRAGVPLLLGTVYTQPVATEERWFNGAFIVDPRAGLQEPGYAKRKLVPFGEYVPLRPILGWVDKFVPIGGDFQSGADALPLALRAAERTVPVGVLICYEDIFPHLARTSTQNGAELLAVLTNNAWFGEGGAAYQHAAHSVLRAVENRRPLLRVGNGGWSGWIDEYGNIRDTLIGDTGTVYFRGHRTVEITRDLRWRGRESVYTRRGDWFLIASVLLATFGYYLVRSLRPPAPARS